MTGHKLYLHTFPDLLSDFSSSLILPTSENEPEKQNLAQQRLIIFLFFYFSFVDNHFVPTDTPELAMLQLKGAAEIIRHHYIYTIHKGPAEGKGPTRDNRSARVL
jgi:hypothetical protein